jgi:hypothetical protein
MMKDSTKRNIEDYVRRRKKNIRSLENVIESDLEAMLAERVKNEGED